MPFDTLILSIFGGRISSDCVGPVMPSLDLIQDKFNLIKHTEPFASPDGEWSISTWRRKSLAELRKHWEIQDILRKEGVEGLEKHFERK